MLQCLRLVRVYFGLVSEFFQFLFVVVTFSVFVQQLSLQSFESLLCVFPLVVDLFMFLFLKVFVILKAFELILKPSDFFSHGLDLELLLSERKN